MCSWSYELRGPAAQWVASTVFVAVGMLIAFVLPLFALQEPAEGTDPMAVTLLLRVLGGTFLLLGGVPLTLMLGSVWVARRSPENVPVWHWWTNFLGGLLGACAFAVPTSLLFPTFAVLYLSRPNVLFPDERVATQNLLLVLLFSAIGWVVLVVLFVVGRSKYRERPRCQSAGASVEGDQVAPRSRRRAQRP